MPAMVTNLDLHLALPSGHVGWLGPGQDLTPPPAVTPGVGLPTKKVTSKSAGTLVMATTNTSLCSLFAGAAKPSWRH